jgi:hypothetical protein
MVPITFSVLGVGACTFLICVLAQFRRELVQAKKGSAGAPRLTEVDVRRIEADLMLERMSTYTGVGQQALNDAVRRKSMLPTAILGLMGLLLKSLWQH